jgi:hypothetical protein
MAGTTDRLRIVIHHLAKSLSAPRAYRLKVSNAAPQFQHQAGQFHGAVARNAPNAALRHDLERTAAMSISPSIRNGTLFCPESVRIGMEPAMVTVVTVVYYPFDMIQEELSVRVEIGTCLWKPVCGLSKN